MNLRIAVETVGRAKLTDKSFRPDPKGFFQSVADFAVGQRTDRTASAAADSELTQPAAGRVFKFLEKSLPGRWRRRHADNHDCRYQLCLTHHLSPHNLLRLAEIVRPTDCNTDVRYPPQTCIRYASLL